MYGSLRNRQQDTEIKGDKMNVVWAPIRLTKTTNIAEWCPWHLARWAQLPALQLKATRWLAAILERWALAGDQFGMLCHPIGSRQGWSIYPGSCGCKLDTARAHIQHEDDARLKQQDVESRILALWNCRGEPERAQSCTGEFTLWSKAFWRTGENFRGLTKTVWFNIKAQVTEH